MSESSQILPARLLIVVVALAAIFLLLSTRVQADEPVVTAEHVVTSGETLWNIASGLTDSEGDVRSTIRLLKDLNEMETSSLRAGQVLVVPAG